MTCFFQSEPVEAVVLVAGAGRTGLEVGDAVGARHEAVRVAVVHPVSPTPACESGKQGLRHTVGVTRGVLVYVVRVASLSRRSACCAGT